MRSPVRQSVVDLLNPTELIAVLDRLGRHSGFLDGHIEQGSDRELRQVPPRS